MDEKPDNQDKHKPSWQTGFHQARWNEPLIFGLSVPGERGVLVPLPDEEILSLGRQDPQVIPGNLRRKEAPALPEVNQMRVLRHFMRLSQQTMGTDLAVDIGLGTCTMKYSPKFQEHVANRHPGITAIHPLQDHRTIQGILEIYCKFEQFLREISGMDRFSFQPGGGAQAIFASASIIRAYHAARKDYGRTEVITTIFSHPANASAAATVGYKVITLMPDKEGYPDLNAMKAALSEKTAGLFITNPEDTGIYNPRIEEFTKAIHAAGGLCFYDQANANGLLGIARAKEAGFDLCHFNVHKIFSAPHGCMGPATGALGVKAELSTFLPLPTVEYDGKKYHLDYNRPESIGRVRSFFGSAATILRGYAWIMQHGAAGLKEVAQCSVLNNQYMSKKVREIPGVTLQYAEGKRRIEQSRYSWKKLKEDTGVGTFDVSDRITDYGLQSYFTSHHPWIVPEPFTLEPCESYSKADIDDYVKVLSRVSSEAYENPDFVKNAPYNSVVHKVLAPATSIDDPGSIAVTWRQYKKKSGIEKHIDKK